MKIRIACALAALAAAAAVQAAPQSSARDAMSREEVKANLVRIEEQYDNAQTRCKRVTGHARELCNERARGERDIQVAEIDLRLQPTPENDQKLRLAKAEARYSLSLIQCKDFDGHARGICRKEAKRVYDDSRAEAKLQGEVAAQTLRSENTVRERQQQADKVAEGEFNRIRERCEALPDEGRRNCLDEARKRFGKM